MAGVAGAGEVHAHHAGAARGVQRRANVVVRREAIERRKREDIIHLGQGVSGKLNWNWLQVSLLWVDESLRGEGYGEKLMAMIEDLGREKGCTRAHLSTFSFQAKAFYESLGYEAFATLDDYPPGHARSFMRKVLQ